MMERRFTLQIVKNNMKSNKIIRALILSIALLFCGNFVRAQDDSLFLKREVKLGGETYGYRVYVPKNRNPKKKLPVMLYLHNNGANGTDNEKQIAGFDRFITIKKDAFNFIVVFPQARPNSFWIGKQTEQAIKALDQTVEEFNGDMQRLYLAGHSLGGYGTWTTAVLYPQKFAALIPIAGGIVPPFELPPVAKLLFPKQIIDIVNAPNPYDVLATKIGDTPVWVFHGDADDSIPVKESRNIVAALKKKGSKNVNYTEYQKTDHNDALLKTFSEPKLYQWLGKQTLKK
jgi:predicted peptidase